MANKPPRTGILGKAQKLENDQRDRADPNADLQGGELYRALMQCADDAMAVLQGDTVVDCNAAMLKLFGGKRQEYIGKKPWEISPVAGFAGSPSTDRSREYIREAYEQGPVRFDWTHRMPGGEILHLDVSLTCIDLSKGKWILVVLRDVTEKKSARLQLEQRVAFQSLLAEISEGFITAEFDQVDNWIEQALELIGQGYDLDRLGLWWLDQEAQIARRSHQWNRSGIPSRTLAVGFDKAPWSNDRALSGTGFHLDTLDDLPPEASKDRALYEYEGVTSLLFAPVVIDEQTVGNLSFVTIGRERRWPAPTRAELRLIGRLVATAYQRHESLQTIRARQADLERSQRVAQVGSFTQTARPGKSLADEFGILKMSAQACEIYGIDPGTESVDLVISRIHPDDLQQALSVAAESIRNRTNHAMDYRIVRPDGSVVYIEERAEFELGEEGQPVKWFGTAKDVTDRVKANEELSGALDEIRQLKDQLHDENVYLRGKIRSAQSSDVMIGDNPRFKSVLVAVEKVAPTDLTVLILGETGTGKELVAREIHELSDRRGKPMISVNCAALSSELIESELFGHESGAFTGAQKRRTGRFELADGGTLFLDEIGDLPIDVQAKILRVIQIGEFERLGGDETLNVDVRLIAATNRKLGQMVKDGNFRADLFYRINSFPIELPPLRERRDDISLLASHFVDKHRERLGQHIESIAPQMIHYLHSREWPGNVRELENFIRRAMIACGDRVLDYTEQEEMRNSALSRSDAVADPKPVDLDAVQQQHILSVLNKCNWVIDGEAGAAFVLGLPPSTLRSRMKRLGIQRPQQH